MKNIFKLLIVGIGAVSTTSNIYAYDAYEGSRWDNYIEKSTMPIEERVVSAKWWAINQFSPREAKEFERIGVSTNRAVDFRNEGMSFSTIKLWVENPATKNLDASEIKMWCALKICTPDEVQSWLKSVLNVYEAKLFIERSQRGELAAMPLDKYEFSKSGVYIERY